MAGVVATSHAKKGSTVDAGLVLPLPVELDEGEDPTEVIVETILTLGAHILFEKYLNASVVPYTCKWVTRSLDELLAVVTMQTRCDFVLPSWDAVPTAIPLDNLARAMVPVTPVHASRYTMVLRTRGGSKPIGGESFSKFWTKLLSKTSSKKLNPLHLALQRVQPVRGNNAGSVPLHPRY
ncbi:hypothetical protein B5M09_005400 [Aphanomyces astaci]|uniref:Uncharacterized protein n=1 Tax=Aphanomyces astaci TaxID=112090 RepID=A0A3R8DEB2_APHAT|nr:hypothetical protein B5M09_005400 [Aphanomyces astaci]